MLKLPKEHCDNLLDIQHPRQLVLKSEPLTFEHQRGFKVNWKFSEMAIQDCSHEYVPHSVTSMMSSAQIILCLKT